MKRVNGEVGETSGIDYAVRMDNGVIYEAEDEADADFIALFTSGTKLMARWYRTFWREVEK